MSEETTVVDTETSEDTTADTNTEKYSIETKTLSEFGQLCRILTGRNDTSLSQDDYYFTIAEMKGVLNWAQAEAITQQDLINQIQEAVTAKNSIRGENIAIAGEIFNEKVAYDANGNQITGIFTIDEEIATQSSLLDSITTALEDKKTE